MNLRIALRCVPVLSVSLWAAVALYLVDWPNASAQRPRAGDPGVVGRRFEQGMWLAQRPVSAADFMATICRILGIDPSRSRPGPGGQTVRIVDRDAQALRELLPA